MRHRSGATTRVLLRLSDRGKWNGQASSGAWLFRLVQQNHCGIVLVAEVSRKLAAATASRATVIELSQVIDTYSH